MPQLTEDLLKCPSSNGEQEPTDLGANPDTTFGLVRKHKKQMHLNSEPARALHKSHIHTLRRNTTQIGKEAKLAANAPKWW